MKTRRILAASTAALLSFASVAIVASAKSDYTDETAPNVIDIGGTKTIVGPAIAENDDNNAFAGYDKDGDAVEGDLVENLSASLAAKDAAKIKGKWAIKGEFVDVPEDDDEKVAVGEDEIKDLGLSEENTKILAKTAAGDVKIAKITIGKDGKTATSISKPLTITVTGTFAGAKVYHVNSDGSVTLLKSDTTEAFSDGAKETTFTTTQFSPFIITTATLKSSANPDAESSDAASSDAATDANNAETGIALAIAPVVLAAGAVAVVALKKKH